MPIIDPHHHLWLLDEAQLASRLAPGDPMWPVIRRMARYLLDELARDSPTSGHNIVATIFVDSHAMYRPGGPAAWRSLGEVEFACGVAAMAASGSFGPGACAGIVGNVDLSIGAAAEDILAAHVAAGGGRYRGVRCDLVALHSDYDFLGVSGRSGYARARVFAGLFRL